MYSIYRTVLKGRLHATHIVKYHIMSTLKSQYFCFLFFVFCCFGKSTPFSNLVNCFVPNLIWSPDIIFSACFVFFCLYWYSLYEVYFFVIFGLFCLFLVFFFVCLSLLSFSSFFFPFVFSCSFFFVIFFFYQNASRLYTTNLFKCRPLMERRIHDFTYVCVHVYFCCCKIWMYENPTSSTVTVFIATLFFLFYFF